MLFGELGGFLFIWVLVGWSVSVLLDKFNRSIAGVINVNSISGLREILKEWDKKCHIPDCLKDPNQVENFQDFCQKNPIVCKILYHYVAFIRIPPWWDPEGPITELGSSLVRRGFEIVGGVGGGLVISYLFSSSSIMDVILPIVVGVIPATIVTHDLVTRFQDSRYSRKYLSEK